MSQPALTKQIRRLERELGVRLFTRSHDGMALTEAGDTLLQHAPRLLDRWQEARRAARRAEGRAAKTLRVAELFNEERCVALPTGHPLAAHDRVRLDELLDEPFVAAPEEAGWVQGLLAGPRRTAGPPRPIGAVTVVQDFVECCVECTASGDGTQKSPGP
ncbi:LysR family transcriptional regulator [Streptomyces sp. GSL17-111]|uniref:LysR family transcriptional regulator n=1 Tax=Streptomyces sp. GSL17-111 TaxID=3121596 RepID=UPI0030F3AB43